MPRTPNVVAVLGQHGLTPGPDGFVRADLEAAIAARGWRADVDERRPVRYGYQRRPHFDAVVVAAAALGNPTAGTLRLARGRGESEAAALAQALAKLLA